MKYKIRKLHALQGKHKGQMVQMATIKSVNTVSFDELCANIERACTVTTADVKAVLAQLSYELGVQLGNSNIVDCGDLGRFHLVGGSKQVALDEPFHPKYLLPISIKYTPPKKLKNKLKRVKYTLET